MAGTETSEKRFTYDYLGAFDRETIDASCPPKEFQSMPPEATTPIAAWTPNSSTKLNGITAFVLTGSLNAAYANQGKHT
ncbi:hypothetical protein N7490_011483 [Penicillium lividum]|nr:hypothetical protein N7490_011483 [Penicillium lividum]